MFQRSAPEPAHESGHESASNPSSATVPQSEIRVNAKDVSNATANKTEESNAESKSTVAPARSDQSEAESKSSVASAVSKPKDEDESLEIPNEFCCPILGTLMVDPVVTEDGHTYERSAILHWLKDHDTSPKTMTKFKSKVVVPIMYARSNN